jgi:diadenosine tetraphosphate (Ap4A) HIT family hydrolase
MNKVFTLHPQLSNDCIVLVDLPLSRLLLCNDSTFPWFILVPRLSDVQDIYQLGWQDQQQLLNESSLLSELLILEFNGDKMNVAALGNVVPQLHVHHIVRFRDDPCWPKPIWGQLPLKPYKEAELATIQQRLIPKLATLLADISI